MRLSSPIVRRLRLFAAVALVVASRTAVAGDDAQNTRRAVGFTLSMDVGGGGQPGAGSAYDPPSLFEIEVTGGYYIGLGFAPELSLVLGMSPGVYFAIRPGLHWAVPGTPFYLRAAVDAATQIGYLEWRWVLLGGGLELHVSDAVGFFAEGDTGIPLVAGAGVPLMVRAGAFYSF
ncbi:MAG TPA: hypothetical protein VMT17_20350 [Anaeromyxobacteraceae bacterium]|nr:hypothetical protein [Anaeromyxobacteraceae bacterium]